jgi:hypothetical protein
MERRQILSEAIELTEADRNIQHGEPRENHERIAGIWSVILGQPITAHQVALCMAGMKLARLAYNPNLLDSYIDGAAYLAIAGEIATDKPKPECTGYDPQSLECDCCR